MSVRTFPSRVLARVVSPARGGKGFELAKFGDFHLLELFLGKAGHSDHLSLVQIESFTVILVGQAFQVEEASVVKGRLRVLGKSTVVNQDLLRLVKLFKGQQRQIGDHTGADSTVGDNGDSVLQGLQVQIQFLLHDVCISAQIAERNSTGHGLSCQSQIQPIGCGAGTHIEPFQKRTNLLRLFYLEAPGNDSRLVKKAIDAVGRQPGRLRVGIGQLDAASGEKRAMS